MAVRESRDRHLPPACAAVAHAILLSMSNISDFLRKRPVLPALVFALLFVALTLPGIEWGLPTGWNVGELVQRVVNALHGEYQFDTDNFDYPSLPKYAMYGLGWLVMQGGGETYEVMLAARALSVLLGALIVYLTYLLAVRLKASPLGASLAATLVLTSYLMAEHARIAHNDIYLAFFTVLVAMASLRYARERQRVWFYLACLLVGLAASSKYNGISLALVPFGLHVLLHREAPSHPKAHTSESLFLGFIFLVLGYGIGTPTALLWPAFYFKRMLPALFGHAVYQVQPDSQLGIIGMWPSLIDALSPGFVLLALTGIGLAINRFAHRQREAGLIAALPWLVLPAMLVAQALPTLLSYNHPKRFFLPLVPLLAALCAPALDWLLAKLREPKLVLWRGIFASLLVATLLYNGARAIGVRLLFQNDARISASEFLAELPPGLSIEYTYYPPIIDGTQFDPEHQHSYPLHVRSSPDEELPTSPFYDFNRGLAGIEERKPYYLVIDSLTYQRFFEDEYLCEVNAADCAFFKALLAGETKYVLIGAFEYRLPDWVPSLTGAAVNPVIHIFQREG